MRSLTRYQRARLKALGLAACSTLDRSLHGSAATETLKGKRAVGLERLGLLWSRIFGLVTAPVVLHTSERVRNAHNET